MQAVIERIHEKYGIKRFALWGRSMGAVTALKFSEMQVDGRGTQGDIFLEKNNKKWALYSLVLDSPFSNLNELAIEIA